jgi:ATPase subunit of ABC transporter with duplicated ATPase domains
MSGDAFYEWLLSDHPEARAERDARRAAYARHEQQNAAQVRAWTAKINAAPDAPQNLRDLAAAMEEAQARADARAEAAEAEPDEVYVARLRAQHETHKQVSSPEGWDYRYPEHLTGPGAARYPRPPEPEAGS